MKQQRKYYDKLIFEISKPGRIGITLPKDDFPHVPKPLPFENLT